MKPAHEALLSSALQPVRHDPAAGQTDHCPSVSDGGAEAPVAVVPALYVIQVVTELGVLDGPLRKIQPLER